jgi:siderophore-iron reductase FhuF
MLTAVPAASIEAAIRRAGHHNRLLGIGLQGSGGVPAGSWRGPDAASLAGDLVEVIGTWLGTDQRRVAASMVVLGYAARLGGPAVALLARDAILLDLSPERVTFAFTTDQGFQVALRPQAAGWHGPHPELLQRWHTDLVDHHLTAVIDAVRQVVPVAAGLLWGNVASGLTGALAALARDRAVPARRCHTIGLALLDHGPLRTAGDWALDQDRVQFTRRSCCLYYRLPGGGMCADCALLPGADPRHTTPQPR